MKLLFAGDFCPFDGYDVKFDGEIKRHFQDADYSFVNLECPLTDETGKIVKCGPNLKASPQQIAVLKDLGANSVTLANNHLRDYGGKAVMDTIRLCEQNGIQTVGAGEDLEAARRILLLEKQGIKVAILNVAEQEFSIAGENSPGANPFDLINVMRDLERARDLAERIVLVVHGGVEGVPYPSPESVRTLRFLAEQKNVIAIIRHHPHVIQGMECWKGVPIYYSLGNFYFPSDSSENDSWYEGLLVELEVSKGGCSVCHHKVVVAQNEAERSFGMTLCKLGELSEVGSERALAAWRKSINRSFYITNFLSPWPFWRRVASKFRLYRIFRPSRRTMMGDYNLLHCAAHLECVREAFFAAAFPRKEN